MHTCEKVKVIHARKYDADHLKGQFLDKSNYDTLITEDTDVYEKHMNEDHKYNESDVILKFRKNVFTKEEQDLVYEGLINAAGESQNRGMAAGPRGSVLSGIGQSETQTGREWVTPYQLAALEFLCRTPTSLVTDYVDSFESETIDDIKKKFDVNISKEETRGYVWLKNKVSENHTPYHGWFDRWVERVGNLPANEIAKQSEYVRDNYISDTNYAQPVMSGVAGYYNRYPRIPYGRATAYTEKHPEEFAKSFPFLRKLDHCFSELLPTLWANQRACADKLDPRFVIDDTVFTTLTVNHNFRTAAHLDAGDLAKGFSNLSAVGKGWEGGELVLPQYKAAVDLRQGDLLLVANHTAIHGNVAIEGKNPDRMSIVAYFREDMLELGPWEYEQLRKQYVEERRLDTTHKLHKPLWNGVSPGMWSETEWSNYLDKHNINDPYSKTSSTLEGFF